MGASSETTAERNRRLFPGFGEFVDDMRRVFGDVKVREVHNDRGDKVGHTAEELGQVTGYWTPAQWKKLGEEWPTGSECIARAKEDQRLMEEKLKIRRR